MAIKNGVQLITYPDSLGGDLKNLNTVLSEKLPGVFEGGVHILPPFPSSGDRGFAPLTYLEIEPSFGTWSDISEIGKKHDILVDLMVNHISRQSVYFNDFLEKGRGSVYTDMFLTLDKIWSNGEPNDDDISKMFLRREKPYSTFQVVGGAMEEKLWTTFGKTDPSEQIDLDIKSESVKSLITSIFKSFKKHGIKIVRLDAVGYVVKKLGTSCFFVEPEIYSFLDWIKELADSLEIELLPEVHDHFSTQYKLSDHGMWIYDFILPFMVLETLLVKDGKRLYEYLKNRPEKQFTMLDCHDGIPVKPDLDDIVNTEDARKIVEICEERGATMSRIVSEKHKSSDGFDVHQIRGSFYSLLNCNDDAYIVARAIQFFVPGIPQVYYVGLLAGENDYTRVEETGEGREINRHNYTLEEIDKALERNVVQRLLKLIGLRNDHQAFNGSFSFEPSKSTEIFLRWTLGESFCELHIDLSNYKSYVKFTNEDGLQITESI